VAEMSSPMARQVGLYEDGTNGTMVATLFAMYTRVVLVTFRAVLPDQTFPGLRQLNRFETHYAEVAKQ